MHILIQKMLVLIMWWSFEISPILMEFAFYRIEFPELKFTIFLQTKDIKHRIQLNSSKFTASICTRHILHFFWICLISSNLNKYAQIISHFIKCVFIFNFLCEMVMADFDKLHCITAHCYNFFFHEGVLAGSEFPCLFCIPFRRKKICLF